MPINNLNKQKPQQRLCGFSHFFFFTFFSSPFCVLRSFLQRPVCDYFNDGKFRIKINKTKKSSSIDLVHWMTFLISLPCSLSADVCAQTSFYRIHIHNLLIKNALFSILWENKFGFYICFCFFYLLTQSCHRQNPVLSRMIQELIIIQ